MKASVKKQTGIWVDAQLWQAYRQQCSREKLKPAEPIEAFLRLAVENGIMETVNMIQTLKKVEAEGLEAYATVLLNWYTNGKRWIMVSDEDEAPIEPMLLETLKHVQNPQLRQQIVEALKTSIRQS